jgi:hypothetical protein
VDAGTTGTGELLELWEAMVFSRWRRHRPGRGVWTWAQVHPQHVPWFINARNADCTEAVVSLADLTDLGVRACHANSISGRPLCQGDNSSSAQRCGSGLCTSQAWDRGRLRRSLVGQVGDQPLRAAHPGGPRHHESTHGRSLRFALRPPIRHRQWRGGTERDRWALLSVCRGLVSARSSLGALGRDRRVVRDCERPAWRAVLVNARGPDYRAASRGFPPHHCHAPSQAHDSGLRLASAAGEQHSGPSSRMVGRSCLTPPVPSQPASAWVLFEVIMPEPPPVPLPPNLVAGPSLSAECPGGDNPGSDQCVAWGFKSGLRLSKERGARQMRVAILSINLDANSQTDIFLKLARGLPRPRFDVHVFIPQVPSKTHAPVDV